MPHPFSQDPDGLPGISCTECTLPEANTEAHPAPAPEPESTPEPRPLRGTRLDQASAPTLPATATLSEVRDWLLMHREDGGGVACPACDQRVKVYPRHIDKAMVLVLAAMYQAEGTDWVQVPRLRVHGGETAKGGDFAKLRYWGLIEGMEGERPDGSSRVGWWRVTDDGVEYLNDRLRLPKYAMTYSQQCLSMEGPLVGVRDALGTRFNYDELMNGVTP